MTQRIKRHPAHIEKAALCVAANRMLDLDNVCAPVGQYSPGGWYKSILRHFKHTHALHHFCRHRISFLNVGQV